MSTRPPLRPTSPVTAPPGTDHPKPGDARPGNARLGNARLGNARLGAPLRLRIERLVLEGITLDAAGTARFQAVLIETLTELLRGGAPPGATSGVTSGVTSLGPSGSGRSPADPPGLPAGLTGTAVPRLHAPAITLQTAAGTASPNIARPASPAALGQAVARSLFAGLGRIGGQP